MIVVNLYRPPTGDIGLAVLELRNRLQQIHDLHKYEVVLLGDLNIDMHITKSAG